MNWTITDNLAMEVTQLETSVMDEYAHQPLFEFKNDAGDKYGVQLTHAGIKFGTWADDGEWIELELDVPRSYPDSDGRVSCGHKAYGDKGNCGEMTCRNYTMKNRENW